MGNAEKKPRSWKAILACGLLFGLAGGFEAAQQPAGIANGYLLAAHDRDSAIAGAAGEFRIVAANLIWANVVDHYHHQYMADGGSWAKNEAILPLLQTIIRLDPHFVEAYQVMGGEILPRTGRTAEAESVLASGIKNNPYDWEMYRELAMLYASTEHRPDAALPYAQAGLAQADDDFSKRLMTGLCDTLKKRVQDEYGTHKPTLINTHPVDRQPGPALAATIRRSRPSASG